MVLVPSLICSWLLLFMDREGRGEEPGPDDVPLHRVLDDLLLLLLLFFFFLPLPSSVRPNSTEFIIKIQDCHFVVAPDRDLGRVPDGGGGGGQLAIAGGVLCLGLVSHPRPHSALQATLVSKIEEGK